MIEYVDTDSKGIWADCEEIDSQMIKRDNPPDAKRFRIIHSNMRLLVTALTAAAGQTANESKRFVLFCNASAVAAVKGFEFQDYRVQ